MTYRKKAEQLLVKHLGVNEYVAEDMIRAIVRDEFKPCAFPLLNAPEKLEDWDVEAGDDV